VARRRIIREILGPSPFINKKPEDWMKPAKKIAKRKEKKWRILILSILIIFSLKTKIKNLKE